MTDTQYATSAKLHAAILDELATRKRSLKTSEIARAVGYSVTAVAYALPRIPNVVRTSTSPNEWTIDGERVVVPNYSAHYVPGTGDDLYLVSSTKIPNLIDTWNVGRNALSKTIATLGIDGKTDPGATAVRLGKLAGALAALAHELDSVKDRPDWLDILTPDK